MPLNKKQIVKILLEASLAPPPPIEFSYSLSSGSICLITGATLGVRKPVRIRPLLENGFHRQSHIARAIENRPERVPQLTKVQKA